MSPPPGAPGALLVAVMAGMAAVSAAPPSADHHAASAPATVILGSTPAAPQWVEVWVDLDQPVAGSMPSRQQRQAQHARVVEQQRQVTQGLFDLGATQVTGVSVIRNALAVRIAPDRLAEVRRLPGVVAVRQVKHRRDPWPPPPLN